MSDDMLEKKSPAQRPPSTRWRLSWLSVVTVVLFLGGIAAVSYPAVANWFSQWESSKVLENYSEQVDHVSPSVEEQLSVAHEYNDALDRGSVIGLSARIPTSDGAEQGTIDYDTLLRVTPNGAMARIKIPKIGVDLPIYHGTSDEVLKMGVGHLEGTSLPVGGIDTHSVLTGHRGLAEAKLFTDLDQMGTGDRFTIEVLGEVLSYQVVEVQVVEPENSAPLAIQSNRDLVTLVTCTPLGINTARILVTAERVTPTPLADQRAARAVPDVPGFPWWTSWIGAAVIMAALYLWWSGRPRHPYPERGPRRSTWRTAGE